MTLTAFTPNGIVKVLSGTGLTNSYTDTYTFTSVGAQEQFFNSKTIFTATHFTPVREPLAIRVPVNSQTIIKGDYLMWQNTNYSNKWFYAFITSIDWVNVNTCQISYEIDVIQTWYFDYTFPTMFIEREHVNNDTVGANLMPENLEPGEWILKDMTKTGLFDDMEFVVWATVDKTGAAATGNLYGGIYSGLKRNSFTSATAVSNFVNSLVSAGKGDAIVSITMVPTGFSSEGDLTPDFKTFNVSPVLPSGSTKPTIDGYTPRNNKLYTYPYNFLMVSNNTGNAGIFRYEFFNLSANNGKMQFIIAMDDCPNPTAVCIPMYYKGYVEFPGNGDELITIGNFPQCAWASDTFKAWLAQNANTLALQQDSIILNTASSLIGNALSGNIGGVANAALDGYLSVRSMMAVQQDKSILPPQAHGAQSGYIQPALKIQDFYFKQMTITAEFARAIDGFFNMYGYTEHLVKTPNIFGRSTWNYVKTQNAAILGTAPALATERFQDILNSGVRFWHGDYIGQYFRPNDIVATARSIVGEPAIVDLSGNVLEYKEG